MSVAENLALVSKSIPEHVTLVAVSKVHPVDHIMQAYHAGHLDFGENKVQELIAKAEVMPKDIKWHLIGHLQTNKVKYVVGFVHMIHSVDSFKLLKEINKRAANVGRKIDCLLQVHIADEESKFGLDEDEVASILSSPELLELDHIQIKGLMGMSTFTDNRDQVRREFSSLSSLFNQLRSTFPPNKQWSPVELSMGMSGDYPIAIEEGSTMVRVGSSIFGERQYH